MRTHAQGKSAYPRAQSRSKSPSLDSGNEIATRFASAFETFYPVVNLLLMFTPVDTKF